MKIEIKQIALEEKNNLKILMIRYFKEIMPSQITDNKLNYPYLDSYWTDSSRIPLFILLDNEVVGFALINEWIIDKTFDADKSIAEFYILPEYRRNKIGWIAAKMIFNRYQGKWEVKQQMNNIRAIHFWRNTIADFTKNNYLEKQIQQNKQEENILLFDTTMFQRK